jgi:hypothetical protein
MLERPVRLGQLLHRLEPLPRHLVRLREFSSLLRHLVRQCDILRNHLLAGFTFHLFHLLALFTFHLFHLLVRVTFHLLDYLTVRPLALMTLN